LIVISSGPIDAIGLEEYSILNSYQKAGCVLKTIDI
jgi:hypothetical protein